MLTTTRATKERQSYPRVEVKPANRRVIEDGYVRELPAQERSARTSVDDERFEEFRREIPEYEHNRAQSQTYDYGGAQTQTDEYDPVWIEPAAPRRYSDEDLMPTIRTMRLKNTTAVENERVVEKSKRSVPAKTGKMSATSKMVIAVYALIVAIVVVLIIATSVAAARRADAAAALQSDGAAIGVVLENQQNDIEELLNLSPDDPRLTADYGAPANVQTFLLKPLNDEVVYEARTSFFDWICNLFSGGK